ncbi:MAG: nitroreductase family protein [Planctomycetota bacterium]
MDDRLQMLMTRRSIRSYTDEDVSEQAVEKLLRAAMAAPSAGNEQPWHFVVIRDDETMRRIMDVHEYSSMLEQAPVCIAVLGELALERHAGFWVQDCAAATQNLLLAANALGLGAVWLGVHPVKQRETGMAEILELPEGVVCFALAAVGHPAEQKPPAERYDPDRVHNEKW